LPVDRTPARIDRHKVRRPAAGDSVQAARQIMGRNRYFARFRRYFEPAWAEIAALHDFFNKTADFEQKMTV